MKFAVASLVTALAGIVLANDPDRPVSDFPGLAGSACDPIKFGGKVAPTIQWLGRNSLQASDNPQFWCETQWDSYTPIVGIDAWVPQDGAHIAGLQFRYANEARPATIIGHAEGGAPQSFNISADDPVRTMVMSDDQSYWWLGSISITLMSGASWTVGTPRHTPVDIANVGSGLIVGAYGLTARRDTGTIDMRSLGFVFLQPKILSAGVSKISYDQTALNDKSNFQVQTQQVGSYYNELPYNLTVSQVGTYTVTRSHSFDQATGGKFGGSISASMEFDAGIPAIGQAKVGVTAGVDWDVTHTATTSDATSTAVALACQFTAPVAPKSGIVGTGTYYTGKAKIPYDSTVTLQLDDHSTITYPEKGTLNVEDASDCNVDVQPDNSADPGNNSGKIVGGGDPPAPQPSGPTRRSRRSRVFARME